MKSANRLRSIHRPSTTNTLNLPGTSGNYASTPDSVALSITGDIDIRVQVAATDWTPTAAQTLIAKRSASGQRGWYVQLLTTGYIQFIFSKDGTAEIQTTSTIANANGVDGEPLWIRVTRVSATGVVTIYKSTDYNPTAGTGTWTQLGTQTLATGALFDNTQPVEIGSMNVGTAQMANGYAFRAELRNGINGTIVASPDFTSVSPTATRTPTTLTDAQGNVWTANGAAWAWFAKGASAPPAPRYVDKTNGLDANDGLTPATAWQTLAKVNAQVWTPGSTIYLKGGEVWDEELIIGSSSGGSLTRPILITRYGTGFPVIDRGTTGTRAAQGVTIDSTSYVTLDGIEVRNTAQYLVKLRNCNFAVVRNCKLHDTDQCGIQGLIGGGNHSIDNNEIYNTGQNPPSPGNGCCIQWLATIGGIQRVTNNNIHDLAASNLDHGVYDQGGVGNVYTGNKFKNISGAGVKINGPSTNNARIYRNVFVHCKAEAVLLTGPTTGPWVVHNTAYLCGAELSPFVGYWPNNAPGAVVRNNITVGAVNGLQVQTDASVTEDHNIVAGTTAHYGFWMTDYAVTLAEWQTLSGQGSADIATAPVFVDAANDDFRLAPGSVGLNDGVVVPGVSDFYLGSAPSIGAYEAA